MSRYEPGAKYDPHSGERLYVVKVRHSGPMSSDRDEAYTTHGPATKAECDQAASDADAYNGPGSTSWHYVTEA